MIPNQPISTAPDLCPSGIRRECFRTAVLNRCYAHTDGWSLTPDGLRSAPGEAVRTVRMQPLPSACYLRSDIQIIDARRAGFVLHMDRQMSRGWELYLEPDRNRLVLRSGCSQEEVPISGTPDGLYRLEVLIEGSNATARVNDTAVLHFRLPDTEPGSLGIFAQGQAVFEDLEMRI